MSLFNKYINKQLKENEYISDELYGAFFNNNTKISLPVPL